MNRFVLAALLALPALTSAEEPAKRNSAQAALLQTDIEWSKAATAGKNVENILSYWADDAVVYPPGQEALAGKMAIRAYVVGSLKTPFFSISWKPSQAVVAASGDVGYTMGENEITFSDAKGKIVRTEGRYLAVWRREGGGSWKCVVDFWNEGVPPVTATPPKMMRPIR